MAEERVQRKLAAILAADVAGYSRLVRADEEGTLAALTVYRNEIFDPAIEELGGRIANTAGDSILAEFPSVIQALRCALKVQDSIAERNAGIPKERRIEFRIGLNVGDVIEQNGDLLGDGVNVAARLEGLAAPGGICLSRAARDQVRDHIDVVLEDLGEVAVKNIERPVRVFQVSKNDGAPVRSQTAKISRHRRLLATALSVLAVAAVTGGVLWWWQPWITRIEPASPDKMAFTLPDKPSIAILPFDNLSSDPNQEYFADGFTEDLITNVAQSKELFVVARNSTFTYKGRAVKIRQVAEELGVRYVLEGSIRRIGENIRITTQLIDATNGSHIWAKRYDEPGAKIFDVQDELSREIAGTLLSNINKALVARASQKRPRELSAYEYMLRGRARWARPGKAAKLEARALAEQALAIDPDYAAAYAVLGDTFNSAYITQWEGPEALDRAYEAARKAVELDPQLSSAHELLGRVLLRKRQHDDAIAAIKRAITLNPNVARHYASLADALTFSNRPAEAVELMLKAKRLDPFYPPRSNMYLGRAYYFAKQFEKAEAELEACAVRAPRWRPCRMYLAATYAELGRSAEAKQAVEALLKHSPKFTISTSVQNHLPFVPSAMQFYVTGLRKAGVPEHPPPALPDKPSIAVLPFANMSDDKEQEYFSDGITEDIITDLSKVSGLAVIARNSSFQYKGKSVDIRDVARDLGVGHVLEGSVRRSGDTLRITAQLIDGKSGEHLWAERFDRKAKDVFAIQAQIATTVATELAVTLKASEQERLFRKHTDSIPAYELFLKARKTHLVTTPDNIKRAKAMYGKVMELDPRFAGGYAGASFLISLDVRFGRTRDREGDATRALELAKKAVSLDPEFGWGHIALGSAQIALGQANDAVASTKRAIELHPNDADALLFLGYYQTFAGFPAAGIDSILASMRLDPKPTNRQYFFLGLAYYIATRYADAATSFEKWDTLSPRSLGLIPLAAAYAMNGNQEKARITVKRFMDKSPHLKAAQWKFLNNFKKAEHRALILEGIKKAGFPG